MSTSSTASSSLFTPLTFQGLSTYSSDFQTIMDRAVAVAKLPITALQNQQADILTEKLSATNLSSAVADLATSATALGKLGASKGLTVSSTSTKVTATVTGATQAAYYQITDITSVASSASETSLAAYGASDAVSKTGLMTLKIGDKAYTINVSGDNTLSGVAAAINGLTTAGVSANVITSSNGSYLSLSANKTGQNPISLTDYPPTGGSVDGAVTITAGVNDQMTITTDAGAETLTLSNSDASLADVVQDINTHSTYATASISVDSGGHSHLVIQSKTTGSSAAAAVSGTVVTAGGDQLALGSAALLTSANPGSNTVFKLNGVQVTESGKVISDVVAGATFTINNTTTTGETIGITLATDRNALSSALQDLVTKYNTVADQVNAQIGPAAGMLSGNSIIHDVRGAMLNMMTYSGGTGQVQSLAALGIEIDRTGKMSFNSDTFTALSDSQISDAFSFLGSETTGFGSTAARLTQISDPYTGTIKAQLDSYATATQRISDQISAMTDRINNMQKTLQAKLQAADSLLASLESQQSILTSSIQSLNYTSYGKDPNSK